MTEKEIQTAILVEFGQRPDMRIWRSAVGVGTPIHHDRPVRFGIAGQPDISGIYRDGRRIEIEVKAAAGRLSERQKFFAAMITKYNGIYVLARSVEDVYSAFTSAGIALHPVAGGVA